MHKDVQIKLLYMKTIQPKQNCTRLQSSYIKYSNKFFFKSLKMQTYINECCLLIGCLTVLQHRKANLCQLRGRETGSVDYGWS